MRQVLQAVAEWAVLASGAAVLVIVAVALWWKAIDRLIKSAGLFPVFQDFAFEWYRKRREEKQDED